MAYRDPYSSGTQSDPYYNGNAANDSSVYAANYGNNDQGRYSTYSIEKIAPPKSTGMLADWRKQDRGKVMMKGGGLRFFGRCFCCSLFFFIVLLLSVILTVACYIKPPNVTLNDMDVGQATFANSSLSINITVSLSVENPNFFSATFKNLEAEAYYPNISTKLGGGKLKDLQFASNSKTTFSFPFSVVYTSEIDPNNTIIADIISRCGFLNPATKQDLQIDYKILTTISILSINVSPKFSNDARFACPFSLSDINKLGLPGLGVGTSSTSTLSSTGGLSDLLG